MTLQWPVSPVAKITPDYGKFIARKIRKIPALGFEPQQLNQSLFAWQAEIVTWACRRGRAAIFADTGLGKTLMQLAWADQVVARTGGRVLIHCPLGVRQQTKHEAEKFGIVSQVNVIDDMSQVTDGISLVNYDKLHKIDTSQFVGVVLDESSILKSMAGKIKNKLIESWSDKTFRLACTATPAPNDFMELGNQAEFLGVCSSVEMLSTYFVHDSGDTSKWRLRKHGRRPFWDWMASWSVCLQSPDDIGHDGSAFVLPRKIEIEHVVATNLTPESGFLFETGKLNHSNMHSEKRRTVEARAAKVAELIASDGKGEAWIVWCDTDYEADALVDAIPEAVELRGSESSEAKERKLNDFSDGRCRILITKPRLAGFGMNWQHCARVAFVGLSFSFEAYYQAVRRCWRFGQRREVHVHIISTEAEHAIVTAVKRKGGDHREMKTQIAHSMRDAMKRELKLEQRHEEYKPNREMRLPKWIAKSN